MSSLLPQWRTRPDHSARYLLASLHAATGFGDVQLFPFIMTTKTFLGLSSTCFSSRFHSNDFVLQRWKDFVPTLNKLADVAVGDPGRAGHGGHILEGDFRAFHDL
jgi:hypothetical protein